MITRRQAALACAGAFLGSRLRAGTRVRFSRVPHAGLQPQTAIDDRGVLHLVYYAGDALKGNLFYVRSEDGGTSFSSPVAVNSRHGSAIARGAIRGAQLAVGRAGRVHVAWNGSAEAEPGTINPDDGRPGPPMLYARLNDSAKAFEPERNLMLHSFDLNGGGTVAADRAGNVYVAWHGIGEREAKGAGEEGEARRRVWVTQSADDGRTFTAERKAWAENTGACGCCGMKLFADQRGNLFGLYRSATESVHRDVYFLSSHDHGRSFQGRLLDKWEINACPMSSMDFAEGGGALVGAWETAGQVYWSRLDGGDAKPVAAPGDGKGRKHPRVALNPKGELLLVWTEGAGHDKSSTLAYQVYDLAGRPVDDLGQVPGVPPLSFAAPVARADGSFNVLY